MPDSDLFECLRCGELIYHAVTYCPHCGAELYPQEDEEPEALAAQRRDRTKSVWTVVAIILLIALAMPFLVTIIPLWVLLPVAGIIILALVITAIVRDQRARARRRQNLHHLLEELGLEEE